MGLPKELGLVSQEGRPRSLTSPVCPGEMGVSWPLDIKPLVFLKNFFGCAL